MELRGRVNRGLSSRPYPQPITTAISHNGLLCYSFLVCVSDLKSEVLAPTEPKSFKCRARQSETLSKTFPEMPITFYLHNHSMTTVNVFWGVCTRRLIGQFLSTSLYLNSDAYLLTVAEQEPPPPLFDTEYPWMAVCVSGTNNLLHSVLWSILTMTNLRWKRKFYWWLLSVADNDRTKYLVTGAVWQMFLTRRCWNYPLQMCYIYCETLHCNDVNNLNAWILKSKIAARFLQVYFNFPWTILKKHSSDMLVSTLLAPFYMFISYLWVSIDGKAYLDFSKAQLTE